MALYAYARLIDEVGDSYAGERTAALDSLEADLRRALAEHHPTAAPAHPAVTGAARSVRQLQTDPALLFDLLAANRQDQVVTRYVTFAELLEYCRLSANPVGRLVLVVFGIDGTEPRACSDAICTGLQLTEHWQDVAEDAHAGRIYLPLEDLHRFGVDPEELTGPAPASPRLRALMAFEVDRARRLLDEGSPLVKAASGRARWAVAGFVAGGHAALDGLASGGFDPLADAGKPSSARVAVRAAGVLVHGARPRLPSRSKSESALAAAYRRCEEITSAEARNFSYGIKLLPPPKRRAMCALYAMARRIDDIGDGEGSPAAKLAALSDVRKDLATLAGARDRGDVLVTDDPLLVALADVARRYPLPLEALDELVDGCEMDVHGTVYRTASDLIGYCRRVAGTVGRLSLSIYGLAHPPTGTGGSNFPDPSELADALGVALQLTNILRDVLEDRSLGRVYLPAEDRERFGVPEGLQGPPDAIRALVAFEGGRAEEWYERGLALLPLLDWRSRACTAAMAGIYRRLLVRIQRDPGAVLQGRISLAPSEKAAVAARALLRGAP